MIEKTIFAPILEVEFWTSSTKKQTRISMSKVIGKVAQIIGPVVDVSFANGAELPKIYDSLEVDNNGSLLILEVQSHIGESTVRTISMDSTDGLSRGVDAVATGVPIQMPIGDDIYGRLFNVIGDAIDGIGNLPKDGDNGLPIHRAAPKFEDLSTSTEVLFTGIKVIDLIEPYAKGGKIGLFGGAGVGGNDRHRFLRAAGCGDAGWVYRTSYSSPQSLSSRSLQ